MSYITIPYEKYVQKKTHIGEDEKGYHSEYKWTYDLRSKVSAPVLTESDSAVLKLFVFCNCSCLTQISVSCSCRTRGLCLPLWPTAIRLTPCVLPVSIAIPLSYDIASDTHMHKDTDTKVLSTWTQGLRPLVYHSTPTHPPHHSSIASTSSLSPYIMAIWSKLQLALVSPPSLLWLRATASQWSLPHHFNQLVRHGRSPQHTDAWSTNTHTSLILLCDLGIVLHIISLLRILMLKSFRKIAIYFDKMGF